MQSIAKSISKYTPIEENFDNLIVKDKFSFFEKPEIVDTKTREEIEKEKEIEAYKLIALSKKRNVVARERYQTETTDEVSQTKSAEIENEPRDSNRYFYGFCTWYVANMRQDVPNNWGNAGAWLSSAESDGWETGNIPKPGSIMVSRESWVGHVGYVESVDGDNFTISEMNYKGWGRVNTRVLNIGDSVIKGFIY